MTRGHGRRTGQQLRTSTSGKAIENYIESFNGKLRDECLIRRAIVDRSGLAGIFDIHLWWGLPAALSPTRRM
jgi:hypothetical protein